MQRVGLMRASVFVFLPAPTGPLEAGCYRVYDLVGGEAVRIACPDCGGTVTLDRGHVIDSTGIVTPAIVCPHPQCRFHQLCRLEDWTPLGEEPGAA